MHLKDWLCEVVHLMQKQDSQEERLFQLVEDVAITGDGLFEVPNN